MFVPSLTFVARRSYKTTIHLLKLLSAKRGIAPFTPTRGLHGPWTPAFCISRINNFHPWQPFRQLCECVPVIVVPPHCLENFLANSATFCVLGRSWCCLTRLHYSPRLKIIVNRMLIAWAREIFLLLFCCSERVCRTWYSGTNYDGNVCCNVHPLPKLGFSMMAHQS